MASLIASIRLVVVTMLICVVGYSMTIWGVGQIFTPYTAAGSLITAADGKVIGSRLIAQKFELPKYFWPRPSAAGKDGYDATSAAGSNKSPTSEAARARKKDGYDIVIGVVEPAGRRSCSSTSLPTPTRLAVVIRKDFWTSRNC